MSTFSCSLLFQGSLSAVGAHGGLTRGMRWRRSSANTFISIYLYIYVCIHIYIYIYIYMFYIHQGGLFDDGCKAAAVVLEEIIGIYI